MKRIIYFIATWTFIGLFYSSQTYLTYLYRQPISWPQAFSYALPEWYLWTVLSPAIFWLGKRLRIEKKYALKSVAILIPTSMIFSLVHLSGNSSMQLLLHSSESVTVEMISKSIQGSFLFKFHFNLVVFWVILGVRYTTDFYRRFREGELLATQLEARLAQAQLQALKMQLNPHFLFNTLHAITALIHKDPQTADTMIARLSDLLRLALDQSGVQEVSLREELDFLNRYLEIEKMRMGERLQVKWQIDEKILDAGVPNLILQPLVENAVRHGIAPFAGGGRVEIAAKRDNGVLCMEVSDFGTTRVAGEFKTGIGLSNTKERLMQLYGSAHTFAVDVSDNGWRVKMTIPFHRMA